MPGSRGAAVLDDLPEPIIVEEILVRLPSKDVLRCRAVRRSWRSATSTNEFMLAHHRRQPALPLIEISPKNAHCSCTRCSNSRENGNVCNSYAAFRTGAAMADCKLWPVLRTSPTTNWPVLHGACDGVLLVSNTDSFADNVFYVCNPATRQCIPLPELPLYSFCTFIVGFYRHRSSGEYRLLYWTTSGSGQEGRVLYYILTVGSREPRCIYQGNTHKAGEFSFIGSTFMLSRVDQALWLGLPPSCNDPPIQHHGNLHWEMGRSYGSTDTVCDNILVFDTMAETFRWMKRPAVLGPSACLIEMDGALALSNTVEDLAIVDAWVMQDYEAEVWAFKFRINLLEVAAPLLVHSSLHLSGSSSSGYNRPMVAAVNDRELLIKLPGDGCLLHCDIDGKFLRSVESKDVDYLGFTSRSIGCASWDECLLTPHLLRESIFPLPSFELREEDGLSKPHPFILAS